MFVSIFSVKIFNEIKTVTLNLTNEFFKRKIEPRNSRWVKKNSYRPNVERVNKLKYANRIEYLNHLK